MNMDFNKGRAELWKCEMLHVLDLYEEFLNEFKLQLFSCSMEKITFSNDLFFFHIAFSYDRYQVESNTSMPIAMLFFENSSLKKSIIDIFNESISDIDIYQKLNVLNQKTDDQGLTYKILLNDYITPLLRKGLLF